MPTYTRFDETDPSRPLQIYFNPDEPGTLTLGAGNEVASLASAYGAWHTANGALVLESTGTVHPTLSSPTAEGGVGAMRAIRIENRDNARLGTIAPMSPTMDVSTGMTVGVLREVEGGSGQGGTYYTGPGTRFENENYGSFIGGRHTTPDPENPEDTGDLLTMRASMGFEYSTPWLPGVETLFTSYSGSNSSRYYRNGQLLIGDDSTNPTGINIEHLSFVGTSVTSSNSTIQTENAIVVIYKGQLTDQEVSDLHDLMMSWHDTGGPPGVNAPPYIIDEPSDTSAEIPDAAAFYATAGGTPPPTVQWMAKRSGGAYDNAENVVTGVTAAAAVNPALHITITEPDDDQTVFKMVASNGELPDAETQEATLTVTQAPSYPTSHEFGAVTINDVNATVTWQCKRADGIGGPDWVAVTETTANGGLSDPRIETTSDALSNTKTTSLHIDTAKEADSGKIRCLATTPYNTDGEPTFEQTLQVIPAGA